MSLLKKIVKWSGIILGGLLLLITATNLILNIIFSIELRNTKRELKAQGMPLTEDEIIPPPAPDSDNAALPIKEAMALLKQVRTNAPPSALKSLEDLIYSNVAPQKVCTDVAGWTKDQRKEGADLIRSEDANKFYAILEKAAELPKYSNKTAYSKGVDEFLPNLTGYRMLIRLLVIKADFEAGAGNTDQAWNTILTGLKLTDQLNQEYILITQLVRLGCDMILMDKMKCLAGNIDIKDNLVVLLIDELLKRTDTKPCVKTIDTERVIYAKQCLHECQKASIKRCFSSTSIWGEPQSRYIGLGIAIIRPLIKKDYIVCLKLFSKFRRYFGMPYYQAIEILKQDPVEKQIPSYAMMAKIIIPSLEIVLKRTAIHRAEAEVCRVGLALKLFKHKKGTYPDNLDALSPDFLKTIPSDPFTGKSLVYRKTGEGFILYSFGPNQKDDGGKPLDRFGNIQDEEYDIAWKCAR